MFCPCICSTGFPWIHSPPCPATARRGAQTAAVLHYLLTPQSSATCACASSPRHCRRGRRPFYAALPVYLWAIISLLPLAPKCRPCCVSMGPMTEFSTLVALRIHCPKAGTETAGLARSSVRHDHEESKHAMRWAGDGFPPRLCLALPRRPPITKHQATTVSRLWAHLLRTWRLVSPHLAGLSPFPAPTPTTTPPSLVPNLTGKTTITHMISPSFIHSLSLQALQSQRAE